MRRFLAALWFMLMPLAANAQALSCRVPDRLPEARAEAAGERRLVPVGGYTLALSWSPEYCRFREQSARDRLQCSGGAGRFGFVLHGLWPDGRGAQWPQYCRRAEAVPEPVVRATLCAMPSVILQQHEWAKHGTCAFSTPAAYFRAARILYGAVRYPDMEALSRDPDLRVTSFAAAFAARNPGLRPGMIRVGLDAKGWLEDVMLCLDLRFRPAMCRAEAADRDRRPVRIWRGGR